MKLLFWPAPEPATPLGRYRILSPSAAIRVSAIQLGTMLLGTAWDGMGAIMTKETAFSIFDAFFDAGGNFFDTSNAYQNEQTETWLGEWMEARDVRDRCIVATKFTSDYRMHALGKGNAVNYGGNSKLSMHLSVRDSLKKLRTDRLDILYLHWWDYTSSIEEVMDALHVLVQQAKVLYLGISNTPAWIVAAANTYAKAQGKTPFVIYQGTWSATARDIEREILPMARQFGMAVAPFGAAGSGKYKTAKQIADRVGEGGSVFRHSFPQTENETKMSVVLDKIAGEVGVKSLTAVAIAYVLAKSPYVFPVVGGRTVEQVLENIEALKIRLSKEQIAEIEGVWVFDLGYPYNYAGADIRTNGEVPAALTASGHMDIVLAPKAIGYQS
ncbi:putative aryl-alcohol dehydrogenase Aad14 [Lasiosphaeris hirsuta]|uniref:Aryl-alcohol dehydrogenase Aad14 n=1 Tax=Lasiosphaeris hirsuta TaxID=260670 RepID=A0AA40DZH0_9PEZI|nr:putative aryl-alcohol dehydrogenase Aad14 [Lasiosphaeris hirsuta]